MKTRPRVIPVGVSQDIHNGLKGYSVRWLEDGKALSYFTDSRSAATYIKMRARDGKRPTSVRFWYVRVRR